MPFAKPSLPAVLYVPHAGEGAFYTQAVGLILPQPVANLQWSGETFQFNTVLLAMGVRGGFYRVTGTIDHDGSVHGTLQRLGDGPQPSYEYSGRHKP